MPVDREAILWTLTTPRAELERFRESSEDPADEEITLDQLDTILERSIASIHLLPPYRGA